MNILRSLAIVVVCAAFPAWALAQSKPQSFAPIADEDLWQQMIMALDDVPMSKAAHQRVDSILAITQREAQLRAASRQKPASEPPATEAPGEPKR